MVTMTAVTPFQDTRWDGCRSKNFSSSETSDMTMSELKPNQKVNDDQQSENDHGNYSDGFESEGSSNRELARIPISDGKHSSKFANQEPNSTAKRKTATPTTGQSWRHNLMNMSSNYRTNSMASFGKDQISQRVLSAKRLKINELRNEIQSLQMRTKDLEDENRMLKRVQKRQEKELLKYDSKKGELPDIYRSHTLEVYSLQNQLRQIKSKNTELERNLNSRDRQLAQQQEETKKLQKMVDEQGLQEKKDLVLKIESLETDVKQKESTIQNLKQQKELAAKSHKRETASKLSQIKDQQKSLSELQNQNEKQALLLKEKDKELMKWAMQGPQRRLSTKTQFLEALPSASHASTSNATTLRRVSQHRGEKDISLPLLQNGTQSVGDNGQVATVGNQSQNVTLKGGTKHIDLSTAALLGDTKEAVEPRMAQGDGNQNSQLKSQVASPSKDKGERMSSQDSSINSQQTDQKENFLQKLQAIKDKFASRSLEQDTFQADVPPETELQHDRKRALLAKLNAIDSSSPKHQNKTSFGGGPEPSVQLQNYRNGVKDDGLVFGSYQPSFKNSPRDSRNSSASAEEALRSSSGNARKSNLMSALFGNALAESGNPSSVQTTAVSSSRKGSLESKKAAGLPWA